jgi:conjugal transfer mating pair stabilization protein TraN
MSKAGLIALVFSAWLTSLNVMADADSEYKAGSDFAHQIKGQGENSLKNFNPANNIPNYTDSPGEKKYYGGVTATGDGSMKADGTQQWTTNEATQAVTDSFINNPKEPISPDAPFIQSSQDVQSRADTIIGNTGQTQCEAQNITHSEFTNYTCERDLLVEQACTRTATIEGDWSADWDNKYFELAPTYSRSGKQIVFSFSMPETGTIVSANLEVASSQYLFKSKVDFMNTSFFIDRHFIYLTEKII